MEEKKKNIWGQYYDWAFKECAMPKPFGSIQWKGTNVCMDLHCTCGAHFHMDTDFLYQVICPKCKQLFAVGWFVKLMPVTDPEETKYLMELGTTKTDENYQE